MTFRRLPFESVFTDESGGNIKTPQAEYLPDGAFPVVDQGKALIGGYTDQRERLCGQGRSAIVFGDHTRCIKYIDFPFCMGADGVKVLRPKVEADLKYLYYFLKSLDIPSAGYDRHYKYLKRTEVVLPPLPEQRRIAAILDQADALRAKRREALAQLDSLTQSIFIEMFVEPAAHAAGWPTSTLKALGKVSTGGTPPSGREGMFGGPVPFLTPGDLESDTMPRRSVTDAGAAAAATVRAGATLVCCIGATIGKTDSARVRSAFNQQLNAVEWSPSIHDVYGLHSMRMLKPVIVSRGASTTLPILKKSAFEKLEITVPPLALQQTFATRIQAVESLKTTHRAALTESDALFASLQHRAFSGGL